MSTTNYRLGLAIKVHCDIEAYEKFVNYHSIKNLHNDPSEGKWLSHSEYRLKKDEEGNEFNISYKGFVYLIKDDSDLFFSELNMNISEFLDPIGNIRDLRDGDKVFQGCEISFFSHMWYKGTDSPKIFLNN
jgi:hypothetical protein